jgi:hypothetical protein
VSLGTWGFKSPLRHKVRLLLPSRSFLRFAASMRPTQASSAEGGDEDSRNGDEDARNLQKGVHSVSPQDPGASCDQPIGNEAGLRLCSEDHEYADHHHDEPPDQCSLHLLRWERRSIGAPTPELDNMVLSPVLSSTGA